MHTDRENERHIESRCHDKVLKGHDGGDSEPGLVARDALVEALGEGSEITIWTQASCRLARTTPMIVWQTNWPRKLFMDTGITA